jgi:hypothetical protein
MASLFKRPLAAFYLAEAPQGFQVMRDLRRLPGTGTRRLGSAVQLEIRAAAERRELALELSADIDEAVTAFDFSATDRDDPETVGLRIRQALGVTDQLQANWKDANGRTGFNAWRARIEEAGVLIFQTTLFESDEASGFAIASDNRRSLILRADVETSW